MILTGLKAGVSRGRASGLQAGVSRGLILFFRTPEERLQQKRARAEIGNRMTKLMQATA
jgi:hypothetical protein